MVKTASADMESMDPIAAVEDHVVDVNLEPELPGFWRQAARMWFARLELMFERLNVALDHERSFFVLISLDPEDRNAVADLRLFADDPMYERLKERLIATYSAQPERPPTATVEVLSERLAAMEYMMAQLTRQMAALAVAGARARGASRRAPKHAHCYFHRRYGSEARNCRRPCTYVADHMAPEPAAPPPDVAPAVNVPVHVTDLRSGWRFLVDSAAGCSYLPLSYGQRIYTRPSFYGIGAAQLETYGPKCLFLDFGMPRTYTWRFELANVSEPIIGADFMRHFGWILDIFNRRVVVAVDE